MIGSRVHHKSRVQKVWTISTCLIESKWFERANKRPTHNLALVACWVRPVHGNLFRIEFVWVSSIDLHGMLLLALQMDPLEQTRFESHKRGSKWRPAACRWTPAGWVCIYTSSIAFLNSKMKCSKFWSNPRDNESRWKKGNFYLSLLPPFHLSNGQFLSLLHRLQIWPRCTYTSIQFPPTRFFFWHRLE